MDISTYLKMMVEFEIIKNLVLNRQKKLFFKNFKPFLKKKYEIMYEQKLRKFYSDKISKEGIDNITNGIKNIGQEKNVSMLKAISKFI